MNSNPAPEGLTPRYYTKTKNNITYSFELLFTNNQIQITSKTKNIIPNREYFHQFNFEEICTICKKVGCFEIEDIFTNLILNSFDNNSFEIEEKGEEKFTLSLEFLFGKNKELYEFHLEKSNKDVKDIVEQWCLEINKLKNDKDLLNEQVAVLTNENNAMKAWFDNLNQTLPSKIIELTSEVQRILRFTDKNIWMGNEQDTLCKWISETKKVSLELLYKATRDGDTSESFHSHSDEKGPTVVLIRTTKWLTFGGFTMQNWDKSGNYKSDNQAFLFSWNTKAKYPVHDSGENAINCSGSNCFAFGDSDILVPSSFLPNSSRNNITRYQAESPHVLNGGEEYFQISEWEVYRVILKDINQ